MPVCVCVCLLCLSQMKFLQSMFAQVISGQVLPGHQSDHLQSTEKSGMRTTLISMAFKNTKINNSKEDFCGASKKKKQGKKMNRKYHGTNKHYLVLIVDNYQVSESQRSEQLKHTRQRGFLQTSQTL